MSGSSRQTASRFSSHAATCWRRCHTGVTATRCNTLQHTATHTCSCSKLLSTKPWGDTATRCNTLQHASTHCNTLQHTPAHAATSWRRSHTGDTATSCNTLQHTATHCNTHLLIKKGSKLLATKPYWRHCNTLQHAATRCNHLQHTPSHATSCWRRSHTGDTTTHCNTLQHTATHCNTHLPMKKGSKLLATRPYR